MNTKLNYYPSNTDFIDIADENSEYFLFVSENQNIDIDLFNNMNIKFTAAVFPDIIFNNNYHKDGFIALELNENINLEFIENVDNHEFLEDKYKNKKSIITIVEGFYDKNEKFLYHLFENLEVNTTIIGGAAGLLENPDNKPIFYTNDGIFSKCAIIMSLNFDIEACAKHGWDYIDGPFIVTSSEKNNIHTIDYKPAFEFYRDIIKEQCGVEINKENFFEISKNYPLGIVKYHGESLVREVLTLENESLLLANSIEEDNIIYILQGDKDKLIQAASSAVEEINKEDSYLFFFNCIGRKYYLDDRFEEELSEVNKESKHKCIVGATTLGEISNSGNSNINILNKTCVVGSVCF